MDNLELQEGGSALLAVGNRKPAWTADDIELLTPMLKHMKKGAAAKGSCHQSYICG
jgi:hypothetical protein